jgi:hypothetical protein
VNKSNIAMYDGIKSKFKTTEIYCPTPADLQHKIVLMAQGNYEWQSAEDELVMNLDLRDVTLKSILDYTGGMGIRLNNTNRIIQQVFINGEEHFGFNKDIVILPNLKTSTSEIRIILGENQPSGPHLEYVSKRMPEIRKNGNDLEVRLLTKSKARFRFHAPPGHIVLNADWFDWNRQGKYRMNGYITSDRTVILKQLQTKGLMFYHSDILISHIKENESEIILFLPQDKEQQNKLVRFSSTTAVQSIQLNNQSIIPELVGDQHVLKLNLVKGENTLHIRF